MPDWRTAFLEPIFSQDWNEARREKTLAPSKKVLKRTLKIAAFLNFSIKFIFRMHLSRDRERERERETRRRYLLEPELYRWLPANTVITIRTVTGSPSPPQCLHRHQGLSLSEPNQPLRTILRTLAIRIWPRAESAPKPNARPDQNSEFRNLLACIIRL